MAITITETLAVPSPSALPVAPSAHRSTPIVARGLLTTARPYQWAKNLAVLIVPGLAVLSLGLAQVGGAIAVFTAFCLAASSVYLLNDTLDRERDRHHPTKRNRPIASGEVHPAVALATAAMCAGAALLLAAVVSFGLAVVVASYLLLTGAYSVTLKHVPIVDVVALAAGFVLRILAGSVAIGVAAPLSLLIAVFWAAMLMALAKRHSEVVLLGDSAAAHCPTLAIYTPRFLRRSLFDAQVLSALFFALWVYGSMVAAAIAGPLAFALAGAAALALYHGLDAYRRGVLGRGCGGDPTRELASNPGVLASLAVAGLIAFVVGLL